MWFKSNKLTSLTIPLTNLSFKQILNHIILIGIRWSFLNYMLKCQTLIYFQDYHQIIRHVVLNVWINLYLFFKHNTFIQKQTIFQSIFCSLQVQYTIHKIYICHWSVHSKQRQNKWGYGSLKLLLLYFLTEREVYSLIEHNNVFIFKMSKSV